MNCQCRWNEWNLDHIQKHGVTTTEIEFLLRHAAPPFPREIGDEKFLVHGQTEQGRYLQVIFLIDPDDEFDFDAITLEDILELTEEQKPRVYVIHARDLTRRQKSNYRRGR